MRALWAWAGAVLLVVGLATPAPAKTKPSSSCVAALKAADELHVGYELRNVNYDDAVQAMTQSLTSAPNFSLGLNGVTSAVNTLTSELRVVNAGIAQSKSDYLTAARKCRAGR